MADAVSTSTLDHIVWLAPAGHLTSLVQRAQNSGFTVIPGGKHTGGLTANALIILPDLTYIELIAFEHPESFYTPGTPEHLLRTTHQWANKPPGFIAYALHGGHDQPADPGPGPSIAEIVNGRLKDAGVEESEVKYEGPRKGGRTKPDGTVLEWVLTTPERWAERVDGTGRPFFCGDVTPREWRVPSDAPFVRHENNAEAVSYTRLLVARPKFASASTQISAIVGSEPFVVEEGRRHRWDLSAPKDLPDGLPKTRQLVLSAVDEESDEEEREYVVENGLSIFELGILVATGAGAGAGSARGSEAGAVGGVVGRLVWVTQ